jgi:hypothetical protein
MAGAQQQRSMSAFEVWLRTGRRLAPRSGRIEYKFNGWHDPDDGKFTEVGAGRYFPQGAPAAGKSGRGVPGSRAAATLAEPKTWNGQTKVVEPDPAGSAAGRRTGESVRGEAPYLTAVHNEILDRSSSHPPEPGTNEWTIDDFTKWKLGAENIFDFKKQWVRGYRSAIKDAASRFGLPAELLAGVAFNEVGGDPLEADTLAYSLRKGPDRDKTSFGNVSIQVRRAAEALGYDTGYELTNTQRRAVIATLENPEANIYVAAKHLSDLRDLDFNGTKASALTRDEVEVIATRFNRGPELPIGRIRQNLDYGRTVTKRWRVLKDLLR